MSRSARPRLLRTTAAALAITAASLTTVACGAEAVDEGVQQNIEDGGEEGEQEDDEDDD
ncbi:hypothetical protein [Modestobacter lapidis]|nr:hypothetical protein [Modestobacter lapidis]